MAVTRVWDADAGDWIVVGVDAVPVGVPVGAVTMWAGSSLNVPAGWLLCDGALLSQATYPELFGVIGYGFQTAPDEFRVPDMRDRFVVGAGTTYTVNAKGGSSTVVLTEANLGAHNHSITHTHDINPPSTTSGGHSVNHTHDMAHTHTSPANTGPDTAVAHSHVEPGLSGRPTATTGSWNRSTTQPSVGDTGGASVGHTHSINIGLFASAGSSAANTGNAGSGTAHENKPPYIGMLFIIKAVT